jgi:hypothetical protein
MLEGSGSVPEGRSDCRAYRHESDRTPGTALFEVGLSKHFVPDYDHRDKSQQAEH